MIKDNIIYFGYGDVMVDADSFVGCMEFTNIKPPLNCGQSITDDIYKNLEIGINLRSYEDNAWDIYKLMKTVNEDNPMITYKGITLDFSNYNEESVRVVRDKAYRTVNMMCLAC